MISSAGHWYFRDGRPCRHVLAASGEQRPPTLRDAKFGLRGQLDPYSIVPSVTTILRSLGVSPTLAQWMVDTALECAATLPPRPDEPADQYIERLRADAQRWSREAAAVGRRIHQAIELCLRAPETPVEPDLAPFVEPVLNKIHQYVDHCELLEHSFATPVYGGTCDCYARLRDGRWAYMDWKTQGTRAQYDHKTRAYDEWQEQLAAYHLGIGRPADVYANIIVSTTKPGIVAIHEWPSMARAKQRWELKLRYYQIANNWWPPDARKRRRSTRRT